MSQFSNSYLSSSGNARLNSFRNEFAVIIVVVIVIIVIVVVVIVVAVQTINEN